MFIYCDTLSLWLCKILVSYYRKHKIPDDAYSLLHASGTIGQVCRSQCNQPIIIIFSVCKFICSKNSITLQAETLKEKRRRAVQFSKAGLDVPEELSLFKRSDNQKASENSVVAEEVCPDKFVVPAKSQNHGISYKNNTMKDSVKDMECQPVRDAVVSMPQPKTEEPCDDALVVATQKIQSFTPSCSGAELDSQVISLDVLFLANFSLVHNISNIRGMLVLHIPLVLQSKPITSSIS